MSNICNLFGANCDYRDVNNLLVGLECEIESVRRWNGSDYWEMTEDASLRNSGQEFITGPVSVWDAVERFDLLHNGDILGLGPVPFSSRTSIHVHANCQNLSADQVKQIILLYALLEPLFFDMVSPNRKHNIHCVPLTETYLPNHYGSDLPHLFSRWHKYTALNIRPLGRLGTIEFRHMHGHNDVELLSKWLSIIENLFTVAKGIQNTQDIITNPFKYARAVFASASIDLSDEALDSKLFNTLIDLKLTH